MDPFVVLFLYFVGFWWCLIALMGIVSFFRKLAKKTIIFDYDPAPNYRGGFITDSELEVAGAFKNKSGICVGVSWETGREIFYNPEPKTMLGIITFGGMGSLKTTSMHIPLALRWGLE